MSDDLFKDAEIIHSYTRAQALEDGVLVDITKAARLVGFRTHTAMTIAAWAEAVQWSQGAGDAEGSRVWHVLHNAMQRSALNWHSEADIEFHVLRLPNEPGATEKIGVDLRMVITGGDHGEPVLTVMLPHED